MIKNHKAFCTISFGAPKLQGKRSRVAFYLGMVWELDSTALLNHDNGLLLFMHSASHAQDSFGQVTSLQGID